MEYDAMNYLGGTIILALFFGPLLLAILIQAMTFVGAVVGHSNDGQPTETYIRIKQNHHDIDEDR